MGLFQKLFKRGEDDTTEDAPITLDVERRRVQLTRLVEALDELADRMREIHTVDDPGWRSRVNEYSRLAGDAMALRREPTRDALLDIVFEVRPVFSGEIPEKFAALGPLQDEVMAAAADLRQLLPGEKG